MIIGEDVCGRSGGNGRQQGGRAAAHRGVPRGQVDQAVPQTPDNGTPDSRKK